MRWLTPDQERVLRTRSSAREDVPIARELAERGIITIADVPCNCGHLPYEHLHQMCTFTKRGEIALMILDVMTHTKWNR